MKSRMILKPIIFTAGLFLLLYVLSNLFLPYNSIYAGPYKKINGVLKAPNGTIDYVVIGDSESSTSISPMEIWKKYGYAGFNCGIPGQRLQDTYYLLQQILTKQSPKVVLLETNAFYRDFNYSNALSGAVEEAAQNLFPVYEYHDNWKDFFNALHEIEKKPGKKHPKVYKGFHYNTTVKPYVGGPYVFKTNKVQEISDQPLLYLNKITKLCKENNIQLILYSTPAPLCWTYEKHNSAAAFAKANEIPYVDMNLHTKKIGINWSKDTRDKGNHLNFYGAKKVTDFMGVYLSENSNLPDHRNEAEYDSWNKDLKKYLVLKKKL